MSRKDYYNSEISRIMGGCPAKSKEKPKDVSMYEDIPGAFDCLAADGNGQDSLDYSDEARFHGEGA